MKQKSALFVGIAVVSAACLGCADAKTTWLLEQTKILNEFADVMATINDVPSYESAKPKLQRLIANEQDARKRFASRLSPAERKTWRDDLKASPEIGKYDEAAKRFLREKDRLAGIPEVRKRMADELKMLSSAPGNSAE